MSVISYIYIDIGYQYIIILQNIHIYLTILCILVGQCKQLLMDSIRIQMLEIK